MARTDADLKGTLKSVVEASPFSGAGGSYGGKLVRLETLVKLLPGDDPGDVSVLSIGAGPCYTEAALSALGYDVTAVDDLNDHWHLIGSNRRRIREYAEEMGVELLVVPADKELVLDRRFDVVTCLDVIEHVASPRKLLNAIGVHLESRGELVVFTPNVAHLFNRLKSVLGKPVSTSHGHLFWTIGKFRGHIKEYTMAELVDLLQWGGFEVSERTTVNQNTAAVLMDKREAGDVVGALAIRAYLIATGLDDRFKDTLVVKARKPRDWEPVAPSLEAFADYYPLMSANNLDDLPEEDIVSSIQSAHS